MTRIKRAKAQKEAEEMKSIVKCLGVAIVGIVAVVVTGCSLFESSSGTSSSSTSTAAESIFQSALSSAATVLSSEGTQQLAIAAAEAMVASQVDDASQQATYNSIIESAIPALASGISSLASSTASTDTAATATTTEAKGKKIAKAKGSKAAIVESDVFKKIVADCVAKFNAAQKKSK